MVDASGSRFSRLWASDWSLTVLLVFLLIAIFVVRPLELLGVDAHLVSALAFSVILISGVVNVVRSRMASTLFGAVAVASVAVHWVHYALYGPPWVGFDALSAIVACAMLAWIVLKQVFREGPITTQRIQGAIAAYLLTAMIFGAAYTWIAVHVAGAFHVSHALAAVDTDPMQRFLYFSLTTLTTVGYGDVTPIEPFACSLAMLEALIGQLFPAILLARLVSMELWYRQRHFEREQAVLDREELAREVARQLRESGA
jgi:hypothetical protein